MDSEGEVRYEGNITDNESQTPRLPSGNYTSSIYYTGMSGSSLGEDIEEMPLLLTQQHTTTTASKLSVDWPLVTVTYSLNININEQVSTGKYDTTYLDSFTLIHQVDNLEETKYTYSDFIRGETYSWTVYAVDSVFTKTTKDIIKVNKVVHKATNLGALGVFLKLIDQIAPMIGNT